LSRRNTAFVLGYHGCDRKLADKVIKGKASLAPSDSKFDWVGPGIYFWEADPLRAWEWAESRCRDGSYAEPGVVGAIIDLRECLDLLTREDQELVRDAHASMVTFYTKAGKSLPTNRNSKRDGDTDRKIRELDCAVIKHLHSIMDYDFDEAEAEGEAGDPIPFYDTVRAMFTEGEPLYEGATFYRQSHVQIAVRNPDCIRGVFHPPELEERRLAMIAARA